MKGRLVDMTPRQRQYLAFINAYTLRRGRPPSESEIATHFLVSPVSAHQMVVALENRGLIRRTPGRPRSIEVLVQAAELADMETGQPRPAKAPTFETTFETTYPDLAEWLMDGGWVVLGRTLNARSLARAQDERGMVWEGKEHYENMDELLRDLNEGIARWREENE